MRASIYARISSDRVGAGLGVGSQEQDCRELATSLGWTIVSVHTDNDISAYSGKRRPGYQALLAEISENRIDAVLAWHSDRLHRSPVELEEYVTTCERHSITTQTVQAGRLDLSTPSGRLVARQLGAVARFESEHKSARVRRAKERSAHAGIFRGGRRPYGYEADGHTVVPDEAAAVLEATNAVLAGASINGLTRDWNVAGQITSMGFAWRNESLRRVLMRPRNAGLMEFRGEVVGKAAWPAIVPEEQWRAVKELLENPERRMNGGNVSRRWLGSGIYRCGVCGDPLVIAQTQGQRAYKCKAKSHVHRRQGAVDELVSAVIVERLRRGDLRTLLPATQATTIRDLEADTIALRSRLDSMASMYAQGLIDAQQLAEGSKSINKQLEATRSHLAESYSSTAMVGIADHVDPGAAWLAASLDRQRAVLTALADVKIMRTSNGRPKGWKLGEPYFRPESIKIEWKTSHDRQA